MHDMIYDSIQKKRIAASARHRVKHSGCTLPSDLLTEAQRRKLNGEVNVFNILKPCTYAEFKEQTDTIKALYLHTLLIDKAVTPKELGQAMGISRTMVQKLADKHGVPRKHGNAVKTPEQREFYEKFAAGWTPVKYQQREDTIPITNKEENTVEENKNQNMTVGTIQLDLHGVKSIDTVIAFLRNAGYIEEAKRVRIVIEPEKAEG